MARPRKTGDDTLLDHAEATLRERGVAGLTLQAVAGRAGVSAAGLVKRFGSKRGMLVAIDRRWLDRLADVLDAVVADRAGPVERVRGLALVWFAGMDDRTIVVNVLSALANDLLDDELRGLLGQGWGLLAGRIEQEIAAAHAAGELLRSPPPTQAAALLLALAEGIRLTWAVNPAGGLMSRAEYDIDHLLRCWG